MLSVCLSVRPSQGGFTKLAKRIGSREQRRTIARDSSFPVPKMLLKFQRVHSQRGRQIEVGKVIIGDFVYPRNGVR